MTKEIVVICESNHFTVLRSTVKVDDVKLLEVLNELLKMWNSLNNNC